MHKTTHDKMLWFKNIYLNSSKDLDILDIGSLDTSGKNYNYRSIFDLPNWNYVGLDFIDGDNVDILVDDIYNILEIEDTSYDVIISGQLFEHLEFFWITMSEISRILKPGGFCCIIAPSSGPKHGLKYDCYRFYEDGMAALARYVDFEILHVSTNHADEAKPWYDTCLVAKKPDSYINDFIELDNRISNIESKLDMILSDLNK
ncbi:methyltransferase domain-containing protein [Methanobrevibacter millerae]|uniref:Methyltransferase domain-containing protein n=1 Tax=Methanobrevibacter millerae TaxID=230361 RepID=A0A1G5WV02_9EURY|nr:methyltransferase domain-containing protein [Methanobrevibacter millerae]SDA61822.1 Methyltransferase domain-containing protein [Methanobrevibacter millerae]